MCASMQPLLASDADRTRRRQIRHGFQQPITFAAALALPSAAIADSISKPTLAESMQREQDAEPFSLHRSNSGDADRAMQNVQHLLESLDVGDLDGSDVSRSSLVASLDMVCPQAQQAACGDNCLNRHTLVLCDPATCPYGTSCTNRQVHCCLLALLLYVVHKK